MRALLIPALFVAGTAHAAEDISYRPYNFLHTGYTDKQVAPDSWRVTGSAHAMGGGVAVALYRVAELAMAANADEVRITSQKVRSLTMTRRFTHDMISFTETATVTVRLVRTPADRSACEEKNPRECMTLPVTGLLARFGDRLGRPTARPGEAPGTPVALVTYDPRQGGPAPWQVEAARRWPEPVSVPVRMTPGLALLMGRLAGSTAARPAPPVPVPVPVRVVPEAPVTTARGIAVPIRLSAAEIERARLQAAAATDGDPRQGVTVR